MLRQLLTILALFSGLATVAEPAHAARLASAVESTASAVQASCTAIRAQSRIDGVAHSEAASPEAMCPRPTLTIYIPTIMLRIDRAHE